MKGWPYHRYLRALLFSNGGVGSLTFLKNRSVKVLWDGTYGFSSLSEKTRKSNHLQMSLQRQHFLLSYFKDPECWYGRGLNPRPPAQQTGALPTESNQAAIVSNFTRLTAREITYNNFEISLQIMLLPILKSPSSPTTVHACVNTSARKWCRFLA